MRPVVIAIIAIWAAWMVYWLGSAFTANASRHEFNARGVPLRLAVGLATGLIFSGLSSAGVDLNSRSVHAAAINVIALVVVAMMTLYFTYSAHVEETNLTKAFPEAYPAYRAFEDDHSLRAVSAATASRNFSPLTFRVT